MAENSVPAGNQILNDIGGYYTEKNVENALQQVASEFADLAYNAFNEGVVPNDKTKATQNALIINMLLSRQDKKVFIPNGKIYIDDTIVLKAVLQGQSKRDTRIIPTSDKNVIEFTQNSYLYDIGIDLFEGFTKAGIYAKTSSSIDKFDLHNVEVLGKAYTYTGYGLEIDGAEAGYIQFTNYYNFNIRFVAKGIYAHCNEASYFNGNNFHGLNINNATQFMYLKQCGGNYFWFQAEPEPNSIENIVCVHSTRNLFYGWLWDIGYGGSSEVVYLFDTSSTGNIVHDYLGNLYSYIKDYGNRNHIINSNYSIEGGFNRLINSGSQYSGIDDDGNAHDIIPVFGGNQDDFLTFADRRYTVTNSGASIKNGVLSSVFRMNAATVVFSDCSINPVNIIIDSGEYNGFQKVTFIAILFATKKIAEEFSILISSDGVTYNAGESFVNNRKSFVFTTFGDNFYEGVTTKTIKIVFKKPLNVNGSNPNNQIEVCRIFAGSLSMAGNTFLAKNGGKLYGNIDMAGYQLLNKVAQNGITASRPTTPTYWQEYYDTTIKKPIWWTGTVWVDAMGTTV